MPPNPIYALPTLLTLGNLLCGFLAIVILGGEHPQRIELAAGLILLAMLFDGFDGLAARQLGRASRFGATLDSLADVVSFGVAPARLFLELTPLVGFAAFAVAGWLLCATALRLARFTSQSDPAKHVGQLEGLPCPASAATIAGGALAGVPPWVLTPLILSLGVLMVSQVPYSRPASLLPSGPVSLLAAALLALGLLLTVSLGGYAPLVICVLFVVSPLLKTALSMFEQKVTKRTKS